MGGKFTLMPMCDTGCRLPGEPEVQAASNALRRLIDSELFAAESRLMLGLQLLLPLPELQLPDYLAKELKSYLLRSAHACGRRLFCATGDEADRLLTALDDLVRALLPSLLEEDKPLIDPLIQAYVARNREEASKWSALLQT
jgi:hypothetical protein